MSENDNTDNSSNIQTESRPRRSSKKESEILGFPRDDVTLAVAGAGLGLAALIGGKIIWDMAAAGQLPNPFAPRQAPHINYSDIDQQRAYQEEVARQQQLEAQQQQQAQLPQNNGNPEPQFGGQTVAANNDIQAVDDFDDGVSYSTTPVRRRPNDNERYNRINLG